MGMILTIDEAQERLKSSANLANKLEIREIKHGGHGDTRSLDERVRAATMARYMPGREVAEITGYSEKQVENLKRNRTSYLRDEDKELKKIVDDKMVEVRDEAVTKLMLAMGLISSENLSKCNARDLSIVASNMSKVVERTLPKEASQNNLNLVIYAPRQKEIKDFNVVEV